MTNNSEKYYKEHSLFNDISNISHRTWNRLVTINNLKESGRPRDAHNYLEKLSSSDRLAVGLLLLDIKRRGVEAVRAELNRGLEIE